MSGPMTSAKVVASEHALNVARNAAEFPQTDEMRKAGQLAGYDMADVLLAEVRRLRDHLVSLGAHAYEEGCCVYPEEHARHVAGMTRLPPCAMCGIAGWHESYVFPTAARSDG